MARPAPLGASLLASAALHAAVLALLLTSPQPAFHPALVFPISLVASAGGGGGGGEPAPAPPPAAAPAEVPPAPAPVAKPAPHRVARPHPTPAPPAPAAAPSAAVATTAGGEAGSGGGGGQGTGTGIGEGEGGDGTGGARVAYGTNPLPPYPLVARRLGKEGVVLLEVLVAPDGRPADVRVVRSCGFAPLDESAVATVRDRWHFIPARRGATPVESRVTVPIRFRLDGDASG